nr:MAG: replication-associated protein [Canine stool-associated circular virus]
MSSATEVKIENNKGQARRWCFTWNNPPQDEMIIKGMIETLKSSYYIVGSEIAPTTGTYHLQGYMEFPSGKRLETLKKISPSIHWEKCKGNQESNIKYCKKDGKYLEVGTPCEQGARTDLDEIRHKIVSGEPMVLIADGAFGTYVRYHRGLEKYAYLVQQSRAKAWRDVDVSYLWGDTQTGKSREAWETDPSLYSPMDSNTGMWWTGYEGQTTVLFDDFRGTVPLHTMLKWLDGYPVQVPVHGGSMYLCATRIFITSNVPPEELYKNCDQRSRDAFMRRINTVKHFCENATEVTGNTRPSQEEENLRQAKLF